MRGRLPPNEDLARSLGVPKSVLYEAVKILRSEGFLVLVRNRLATQAALDMEEAEYLAAQEQRKQAFEARWPIIVSTPVGELPYYVYTHSYPKGFLASDGQDLSDIVFYVGKGTWFEPPLIQRIDMHEHQALWGSSRYSPNEHKLAAIKQIWAAGKSVTKQVIFESSSEGKALEFESKAVKQFASPYLTNRQQNPFWEYGRRGQ